MWFDWAGGRASMSECTLSSNKASKVCSRDVKGVCGFGVIDCTCVQEGGAVKLYDDSSANMSQCTLSSNEASRVCSCMNRARRGMKPDDGCTCSQNGGAIELVVGCSATMSECMLSSNKAGVGKGEGVCGGKASDG